jgi:hypothetical protein
MRTSPGDPVPRRGPSFFARDAVTPEETLQRAVAEPVAARTHALTAKTLCPRTAVGKDGHVLSIMPRLLPDRLLDRFRLKMLGLPTAFGAADR